MPRTKEKYLTIIEAAKVMEVHEFTIRRWIYHGRLQALKQGEGKGSRYRISSSALTAFKKKHSAFL